MALPRQHYSTSPLAPGRSSSMANAYLLGVWGVLLALVLVIGLVARAGWLETFEYKVRSMNLPLPGLPSLGSSSTSPLTTLSEFVDSLVGLGKSREALTTGSFERARGIVGGVSASGLGSKSSGNRRP